MHSIDPKWRPRAGHRRLIATELLREGVSPKLIANQLGISRTTLWRLREELASNPGSIERLRSDLHRFADDEPALAGPINPRGARRSRGEGGRTSSESGGKPAWQAEPMFEISTGPMGRTRPVLNRSTPSSTLSRTRGLRSGAPRGVADVSARLTSCDGCGVAVDPTHAGLDVRDSAGARGVSPSTRAIAMAGASRRGRCSSRWLSRRSTLACGQSRSASASRACSPGENGGDKWQLAFASDTRGPAFPRPAASPAAASRARAGRRRSATGAPAAGSRSALPPRRRRSPGGPTRRWRPGVGACARPRRKPSVRRRTSCSTACATAPSLEPAQALLAGDDPRVRALAWNPPGVPREGA
jgi:biotin operon repressor